jgi:hypothetical protein
MEKIKYELNEKQQKRYRAWKKKLPKISQGHFGAVGGGYWFKFSPTSIGIIVEVGRDDVPEMDMNLTDFESW